MADGTVIMVVGVNAHPESGHISVQVQSTTTQGSNSWKGPVKTYGVDANMFKLRFNQSIDQLMSWIASEHLGFHGSNQELLAALDAKKGTVIG